MYLKKFRVDGKTAFITGGGRGIGLACAEALFEAGAHVIISDVSNELLASGCAYLEQKGYTPDKIILDVTKPDAVAAVALEMNQKHGAVDILIANAGVSRPNTPSEGMSDADWCDLININVNGVFWSCREFGKYMLERQHGSIVTLGSISGLISNRPQYHTHYNTSKAAVHHLTKSLGAEWAKRGVRVNSVAPTYVDTPMSNAYFEKPELISVWLDSTPMGRVANPDEVASAVLFLSSTASSAMTGAIVPVDCGYTIW